MPIYFCPSCWTQIHEGASICPVCGADLAALDREPFDAKLIRALRHPEPLTARRAAWILGRLRARGAVPALLSRYRAGVDPFLGADIAAALGRIGGSEAHPALDEMAGDRSFLVRRTARAALEALERGDA